eukprot:TRINITY_DN1562_c0_g1_i1.p1 TRINITY_DN1562_c0_g1~~TRINITY_DN1562_c0_g1_i1.p1  ORF type:complete len:79 (+),score=24.07 TRINITY_DN1562_c0_g1_i1:64-300(+)
MIDERILREQTAMSMGMKTVIDQEILQNMVVDIDIEDITDADTRGRGLTANYIRETGVRLAKASRDKKEKVPTAWPLV